ncbi:putative permease [Larkinella arboricola]|uniref:Putative permease n=1 Tax=Larkinella arboricola TaxID=643671 RepID=A0A327X266_LARAB|nr:ABC transporter permease [Larkinella arboricola]RAK00220.1 putative permease [Larkinella arboricola]
MLTHYLTLTWRHFWQNRSVNLISIGGLAVGLTSGLIIFLVVNYLFSFDRYHPHLDRSYWIVTDVKGERTTPTDAAPRPLAEVLRRDYPFVESATRLETFFGRTISVPDGKGGWAKKFNEARNICFAEPQYFDLFGIEWVSGHPETALNAPNTIVISERYARKYFDSAPAIGRTLRLDNRINLIVTGVIKNPPANTQLRYDALVSYATIPMQEGAAALEDWVGLQAMCFVRLREGADPQQLQRALPAIGQKYLTANDRAHFAYQMLPLEDLNHERSGTAPRPVLYALIAVGLLLVLAACVNYINLATARALRRSREVGVRKVVGSTRWQLMGQLLLETALITLAAVLLALLLTQLALPVVNQTLASQIEMLSPEISIGDLLEPRAALWFVSLIIVVILSAGFYPALVLAGFDVTKALAGLLATRRTGRFSARQGLIVGQFILAQLFLMAVLVITAQMHHMQTAEWGFRQDNILSVWLPREGTLPLTQLKESWLQQPGVTAVTFGSDPPASPYNRPSPFSYHTATEPEPFETRIRAADENYLPVFGLSLVAGRNFRAADTTGQEVLVNQTLVRQLGTTPQAVVGKRMRVKDADRTIVGVIRDFRSGDLHQPILPVTLIHDVPHSRMAMLSLAPDPSATTLKAIQQVWDKTLPDQVYRADFLSDLFKTFTGAERLIAALVQVFAGIAISMSCLGLYGLVTFMAEVRSKEIGVRRVLGARTGQLLWLFGREFGKLLALGFIIAAPLGWWLMTGWLQQYAHRIPMSGWLLVATLVLTVLITGLTVFRQALRATLANPVHYLRVD